MKTLMARWFGVGWLCWLLSSYAHAETVGVLVYAEGRVELQPSAAAPWRALAVNDEIPQTSRLRTGDAARAWLLLADESLVKLGPSSRLDLTQVARTASWAAVAGDGRQSNYRLASGRLWLRNKGEQLGLEIATPAARVTLEGTELQMALDQNQQLDVEVMEGRVLVWNQLGRVGVAAGQRLRTRAELAPSPELIVAARTSVQWSLRLPRLGLWRALRQALVADGGQRVKAAWELLEQGEAIAARDEFAALADTGPGPWAGRAIALFELHRPTRAEQVLHEARERYPGSVELALVDGWLALASGDLARAEQRLDSAGPGPLTVPLTAMVELVSGAPGAARDQIESVLEQDTQDPDLWVIKGFIEQQAHRLDQAAAAYRRAIALAPDHLAATSQLIRVEFGRDRIDTARSLLEGAQQRFPGAIELALLDGFLQLAEGQTVQAIETFEAVSARLPSAADAWLGLGIAQMRQGDEQGALRAISIANLIEPQRSLYVSYHAKMLHQLERHDQALELLGRAAELDPLDPTPHLYRALVLKDLNRPGAAIVALNRATELNDQRGVYRSRFLLDRDLAVKHLNAAEAFTDLGLDGWARSRAEAAVRQDQANSSAHAMLADAYQSSPGRQSIRDSANLMARLIAPATTNAFSTLNDQSLLFEQPALDGQLTLTAGKPGRRAGEAIASLSAPELGLVGEVLVRDDEDDGWRDDHAVEQQVGAGLVKWSPGKGHDLLLSYVDDEETFSGFRPSTFRNRYHTTADFLEAPGSESHQAAELGYHWRIDSDRHLMMHAGWSDLDRNQLTANPLLTNQSDLSEATSGWQMRFLGRITDHQWSVGSYLHRLDQDQDEVATIIGYPPFLFHTRRSQRLFGGYITDHWDLTETLGIEAMLSVEALDWDHKTVNLTSGSRTNPSWSETDFLPRLGLAWTPIPELTLGAAYFAYRPVPSTSILAPTQIAGLPVWRDLGFDSRTKLKESTLGLDYEWSQGHIGARLFRLTNHRRGEPDGSTKGIELEWNQMLAQRVGISARYTYLDVVDRDYFENIILSQKFYPDERRDRLLSLGVDYIDPNGLFAELTHQQRWIEMHDSALVQQYGLPANEEMSSTDVTIGFRFPNRKTRISFAVENLFDHEFNWVTDGYVDGRAPGRSWWFELRHDL